MTRRPVLPGASELFRRTDSTSTEAEVTELPSLSSTVSSPALRGVALLVDTIDKVKERLNPQLEISGILATMYDSRTVHCKEVFSRVVEAFGDTVFQTVIQRTVRFPETTVAGQPITTWAPTSSGAAAYRDLAKEVIAL